MAAKVCVYLGEALAGYGFGDGHPFGPDRLDAFRVELEAQGLVSRCHVCSPTAAGREQIQSFHTAAYVDRVIAQSATGNGFLDRGDTPAFKGIYEAASTVVGTTLDAVDGVMRGRCVRAFVPIAGLHHARRDGAAGFCVFNDCGVAIEILRKVHGVSRVAYVDIDAHHGDGVFYAFEDDPEVFIVDLHEDGRFLYPGTGAVSETGRGDAAGTKLNIPMPPEADDRIFYQAWRGVEDFIAGAGPECILFQCGADSIAGDPITHLRYSPCAHAHAAASLCRLADRCCGGRLVAMGGGGYNRANLAAAWSGVVRELVSC